MKGISPQNQDKEPQAQETENYIKVYHNQMNLKVINIIKSIYKKMIYDIQSNRDNNSSRLFTRNKANETAGEWYFYGILSLEFSNQPNHL